MRRALASIVAMSAVALATAVVPAAVAVRPAAATPVSEKQLVVSLTTDGSFLQAGKPVRVQLALENRGTAAVAVPNGVLFGQGLIVTPEGGAERPVLETAIPAAAKQSLLLPAGGRASASIDLAPLLPDLFTQAGRCTVVASVAGVDSAPLALNVTRDWHGWNAVLTTEQGEIELEFFPDAAPRTVDNFLSLAARGFYDGLTFHRVVKGFMVQGGDPKGDGTGVADALLPFEKTGIKHERGAISMARQADFNSASCQFFLVHQTAPFLDGNYAAFGRIVRGLDVLDRLADVPCIQDPKGVDRGPSKPKARLLIQSIKPVAPAASGH